MKSPSSVRTDGFATDPEDQDSESGSDGKSTGACSPHRRKEPDSPRRWRRWRRGRGDLPLGVSKQRQAANARERDRTHSVNTAFTALRTLIPTEPADRKLSKVETLRLACSYISHLANMLMLGENCDGQPCLHHQPTGVHGLTQLSAPPLRAICTFCLSNQRKQVSDQPNWAGQK
ncbi:transcription factor 15-like [Syngnathoides biaculeatus]|uniref:transcription factor 15-like n=1 Tax=Syngnathoides biaculeatus TaxID=300417 RepID=UPI002ADDFE40|nr:transcription factor 15-like [Syngnathoides biaculeatus]